MKVVATYSIKGGVGKTTAAVNLAYEATRAGVRVLLFRTRAWLNAWESNARPLPHSLQHRGGPCVSRALVGGVCSTLELRAIGRGRSRWRDKLRNWQRSSKAFQRRHFRSMRGWRTTTPRLTGLRTRRCMTCTSRVRWSRSCRRYQRIISRSVSFDRTVTSALPRTSRPTKPCMVRRARLRKKGYEIGPGGSPPLKTAPKGCPADHPRIELLRWKGLIASLGISDLTVVTSPRARAVAMMFWKDSEALTDWLDKNVGPTVLTYQR